MAAASKERREVWAQFAKGLLKRWYESAANNNKEESLVTDSPERRLAVGVVLGSKSDLPVVGKGLEVLDELGIPYEVRILSAHRTPDEAVEYAKSARERGLVAIVAAAGRAAHLPGVLASHTILPVIGVPIGGGPLAGVDALYSIVQMPSGVPVAAMGIDGAVNAALFAAQIVALTDGEAKDRLAAWRQRRSEQSLSDDEAVRGLGWRSLIS